MTDLAVIIVNYNVKHYLWQCLDSVKKASVGLDVETVVVDNDSTDGSVEYLEPLFPNVKFIRAGGNLGFSKANNKAVALTDSRYILFLNPDTIVGEKTLGDCIRFMDNHPSAGMTGVCMLNRDGTFARESRRAVPTPFVSLCKMSGLCSLFPKSRLFGRYYLGFTDISEPVRIEVISGAFMFVRREAFNRVGGFDETFFMYGEDIDLSFRVLKEGYENWYAPYRILHYKGESTNKTSYGYAKVFYNAMQIFFDKHYSTYGVLFRWLVRAAVSVQTVMSYIGHNLVGPCEYEESGHGKWLYAGHEDRLKDVSAILNADSSNLKSVGETLPDGSAERDYTIYDVTAFSYGEILDNLSDNAGTSVIATYNPERGIILTDSAILKGGDANA